MKLFDHGYALLIGVNEYMVEEWSLPGVLKDIDELEKVLKDPERCAYPGENIEKVTGSDATVEGIMDGLEWLRGRIQADDTGDATVIIYYSGHGWRDNSSGAPLFYLIPYDVNEQDISSSAIKADEFFGAIASLNPRRLLVLLDCCHAGGMEVKGLACQPSNNSKVNVRRAMKSFDQTFSKVWPPAGPPEAKRQSTLDETQDDLPNGYIAAAIPPVKFMGGEKPIWKPGETEPDTLARGHGRAVLSSSTGVQQSYKRREDGMGIFTYHLIEALTGHARPQEGATEVLVSDVMSYVWRTVPLSVKKEYGQDQVPDYNVNGNFPIALLLGSEGKSLETKTDNFVQIGLENLELEDYEAAMESFQKARELMPEDKKIQVYYYLTLLAGKPILSFNKQDMNIIAVSLKRIVNDNDLRASNLARLILGIIWYDYYVKVDHHYQESFFRENTRYLGNYQPRSEEKQLIGHIVCTNSAKYMFNLS